jgi:hypothetical protein
LKAPRRHARQSIGPPLLLLQACKHPPTWPLVGIGTARPFIMTICFKPV